MNVNDKPDALAPPQPLPTPSPLSDRNDHETRACFLGEKCAGVRTNQMLVTLRGLSTC